MSLWVAEFFCETEIDDVDLVTALPKAHREIIRLDIAVDEITSDDTRDLIETMRKRTRIPDEKMNEPAGLQAEEQSSGSTCDCRN